MKKNLKRIFITLFILFLVGTLVLMPYAIAKDSEFKGADDAAMEAIMEINPEYTPWMSSVWEPPSDEAESLLFTLQAAIGSVVLLFGFGYLRGRNKKEDKRVLRQYD